MGGNDRGEEPVPKLIDPDRTLKNIERMAPQAWLELAAAQHILDKAEPM